VETSFGVHDVFLAWVNHLPVGEIFEFFVEFVATILTVIVDQQLKFVKIGNVKKWKLS
jgi:hypothetical protein